MLEAEKKMARDKERLEINLEGGQGPACTVEPVEKKRKMEDIAGLSSFFSSFECKGYRNVPSSGKESGTMRVGRSPPPPLPVPEQNMTDVLYF
jgi:hypothetical protein